MGLFENALRTTQDYVRQETETRVDRGMSVSTPLLDIYFLPLKDYLQVLENSRIIHNYIIVGDPGIGKSFTVIQGLRQMRKREGRDFVVLNGYTTPLSLYEFLYHNNGKTIVCDDISNIFKNDVCKKILLSALWNPTGRREIHYASKSVKLKVPKKFHFSGKLVIIANSLPDELENLKSRGLFYRLNFTYNERVNIIYEICNLHKIPLGIADFIRNNTDESYEVNFRLPLIVWEIFKTHKNNGWKELALRQLRIRH